MDLQMHAPKFLLISLIGAAPFAWAVEPAIAPAYVGSVVLENLGPLLSNPTQLAWGPAGLLYVRSLTGVQSYTYDPKDGKISSPRQAVQGFPGIGLAFHSAHMYLTTFDGAIRRLDDQNGNGIWGEPGELNVAIVTRIPVGAWAGDHHLDQLAIVGDTLYVGIGQRTNNGRTGIWTMGSHSDDPVDFGFWDGGTGWSWGETVYGGTISWIRHLDAVPNVEGTANTFANTALTQALIQTDGSPVSSASRNAIDKLVVHSAGTRNPYGLCLDGNNNLWFTNNYNRADTNADGTAGYYIRDAAQPDFSKSVHDQLFRAIEFADYGFANENWRPLNPMLDPDAGTYNRVNSLTFDNLYNPGPYLLHNPALPDGLGPNSSATGCGVFSAPGLPTELQSNVFITRYNPSVTESVTAGDPVQNTLTYSDVVAVDPGTGTVRRVAQGFAEPIAVLADGPRRLLVADYVGGANGGRLFAITSTDNDNDGVLDTVDNCLGLSNADQRDTNADGYGNICDPDFNNNGIVDSQDGALLKAAFGSSAFPDRDLNGNGIVDSNDGARLKARFGKAPGPSGLRP